MAYNTEMFLMDFYVIISLIALAWVKLNAHISSILIGFFVALSLGVFIYRIIYWLRLKKFQEKK